MKPARFAYHRPGSLAEALSLYAELGDDARLLSGGQSLVPVMNMRLAAPPHLIDLNDCRELDYLRASDAAIEIGALTRQAAIERSPLVRERCPLLAEAAASIGHYAIRERGTLGGSLAHADPAAQLPLVAMTFDADILVAGVAGQRVVKASEFFVAMMTTSLAPGEIVVGARFPQMTSGEGYGWEVFSRRQGDFALFAAAATVRLAADGSVAAFRLGGAGASPVPMALHDRLSRLAGESVDPGWPARVAAEAATLVDPDDDPRVPVDFRLDLVRAMTARALDAALGRACR